jgi:hypothetical protein
MRTGSGTDKNSLSVSRITIKMIRYTQIYLGTCQESRYLSEDPLLRSGIYLTYPLDTYLGT